MNHIATALVLLVVAIVGYLIRQRWGVSGKLVFLGVLFVAWLLLWLVAKHYERQTKASGRQGETDDKGPA